MQTNFGTGFGPSFGMAGWNNQQFTTPTKQQKFPGLSADQIKRLESLTSDPQEQQKLYKQAIQQINQNSIKDNRIAAENEMTYRNLNAKDTRQQNYTDSNVRLEQLSDLAKNKYGLNQGANTPDVINGVMAMAQDQGISLDSLNKYLDSGDETFLYQMGLKEIEAPKQETLSLKGSLADGEKGEWNDNLFGRLETEQYDKDAGFWSNAGTFGKNLLKSGVNVLSDVGNMIVNPLDTANALGKTAVGGVANLLGVDDEMSEWGDRWSSANDTADQVGQFFSDRYGGGEEILNTLFTDPVGVISDVATVVSGGAGAVRGIAKAGAKGAAKAGLKGAATTLEKTANTAGKIAKAGLEYDPYSVAMKLEMKPISATIDYAKKVPGARQAMKEKLTEAVDKAYGLDNLTKKDIQNNPFSAEAWQKAKTYIDANGLPEKSTEVAKTLITDVADRVQETMKKQMEELGESGPMYKPLKEAGFSVDLSELKAGLDNMLNEYGIIIEDGKLDFSKTAIDGSEANNIRKIYNWVQSTDKPMGMTEYLDRFRRTMSDMVDFNPANKDQLGRKITETPGDKVIKGIRESANQLAHEQVPALKDLDSLFKKQVDLIDEVTEGIVYKDSKKKGVVRDNINQIMKNLDEPNRRVLKARLEKILPGIEEEVKAINMLPKLIDHYYKPSKLQQNLTTWGGGAVGGLIGGTPGAIIGAGAGYLLSNWIDKLKSKKRDKIISETSEEGANKLTDIKKRIAENQKITQDQKAFLNEISSKLKEGKAVKEGEILRIISEVSSAGDELGAIDKAISELDTLGAKEELKQLKEIREGVVKSMEENAEMDKYAKEFEAEKENIINESADQRLPEFKRRIYQLGQEERRIGSVAGKKIGKNFEGKDYKNTQQTEWLRKKDRIIEEIGEYYNVDQFEAAEIYDRIERTASADDLGFSGKPASSKTAKYQVADDYVPTKDSAGKSLSKQQQDFFKGTKVVDKNGNLLRVYHGTVAGDFTVFQKYGNRTSNNIASDVGFWFTPNKKGAINFAKESSWRGDNKARAEEVYLDIKNPKVYEPSEFNLKDYEERDKLIDSKYKEVYAARNEMNKYDYNHFWMGEYTHDNSVNRGIFNKLEYIYDQKGKITEADLKDIKEEYGKINWDGYYKPEIDATYEDFKNYLQAKKKYDKLNDEYLEMKHSDSYDDFKADIYKLDNKKRDKLDFALDDMDAAKKYIDNLKKEGYDGIIIKGTEYDGATLGEGARNDQYVAFDSNQIKRITNENPTKNEDIRYQKYGVAGQGEKGISATEGLNIRNFKNGKTVQELANQYGIDTKIVDSISTPEGQRAYGMYGDRLITLSKDLKESTVPHELLHGVFDMVDSKRRTSILEGIQKKLNIDNVQAEEWLADSFSEYYRTGKFGTKGLAKGLVEKVKQFFYEVKSYIDGTYKNEKQIRQLFDDIIDGKIEGEYGVYSDPKFQSVWHGSPADFERFDSTHMGEGEGAQAHGWGHYVAKEEGTGRHYAEMARRQNGKTSLYKGKTWNEWMASGDPDRTAILSLWEEKGNKSLADFKKWWLDDYKEGRDYYKMRIEAAQENLRDEAKYFGNRDAAKYEKEIENLQVRLNTLEKQKEVLKKMKESDFEDRYAESNLYEVEIPDPIKKDTPTGSNYLEEDKYYSKAEVKKFLDAMKNIDSGWLKDTKESRIYDLYNKGIDIRGKDLYDMLAYAKGDKQASKFLESLGYDGIHYYGGRDGEAYVIFNDDALEITKHHKY